MLRLMPLKAVARMEPLAAQSGFCGPRFAGFSLAKRLHPGYDLLREAKNLRPMARSSRVVRETNRMSHAKTQRKSGTNEKMMRL